MLQFDDSTIAKNKAVAAEYFKAYYPIAYREKKFSGGTIGFIPFNIEFTVDGLSGIKIYNKLRIDTSFLPNGYPLTLDFIVTGIEHKLKDGDWETIIKVTLIPKLEATEVVVTSANFKYIAYKDPVQIAPVKIITEVSAKDGARGDLFKWSQGTAWPDPHVPSNYDGRSVTYGKKTYILDEKRRQGYLNFETKGYLINIFNDGEAANIKSPGGELYKLNAAGSKVTMSKDELELYFNQLLLAIGAEDSKYNLLFIKSWRRIEGAKATYNAFNSTQTYPGSTIYNDSGVQNYKTQADGVAASAKTMQNGLYPVILKALRVGLASHAECLELAKLTQQWSMPNIPPKWK